MIFKVSDDIILLNYKKESSRRGFMKKYFLLLALVAIAPIFQTEAMQIIAPSPRATQQEQIGQEIGKGIGI